MKHRINPQVDCVFKALLGAENNRNLLIHFINAMLQSELPSPVATVELLNPYNDKEWLNDKLSIVNVKARDQNGNLYQLEIQLLNYKALPARMLYTWADIYTQQLQNGLSFQSLQPTYAIWLLAENLFKDDAEYRHAYKFRNAEGTPLIEHGGVLTLELNKFHAAQVENEQQRWLKFFKDGGQLNDAALPHWMQTREMIQAMTTLTQFSDKERDYHRYQARQNYLREQLSIAIEQEAVREELEAGRRELEAGRRELEAERRKRETQLKELEAERREREAEREAKLAAMTRETAEREAKEAALAELKRLNALLKNSGLES